MTENRKHVSHSSAVVICLYISVSFLFVRRNCNVPVLAIDFFFLFRLVNPSNCNTNCSELLEFPMFWSAHHLPSICAILHTGTGHCCIIFAIPLLTLLSFAEDKKSPAAACFQTCQTVSSDALKVPDRCAFITACQLNGFMFSCWEVDESPPEQLGGIDFSLTFCLNLTVASWLRVERVLSIIF